MCMCVYVYVCVLQCDHRDCKILLSRRAFSGWNGMAKNSQNDEDFKVKTDLVVVCHIELLTNAGRKVVKNKLYYFTLKLTCTCITSPAEASE